MRNDLKYEDPIDEIYEIRKELSAEYGHDLNRIFADAWRKRDEAAGFKYVRLPIARTAPVPAMA